MDHPSEPSQGPVCVLFDRAQIMPLSPALIRFSRRNVQAYQLDPHTEHRRHPRRYLCSPFLAVPVDPQLVPRDRAFEAVVRDLSLGGLGFYHSRMVQGPFMVAELPTPEGHSVQQVVQIVRCRPVAMFFEVGGYFPTPLDDAVFHAIVEAAGAPASS